MSDCGSPANVGSMEGLGAVPEQAGWALEMHGQCVLFANNSEKANGSSPGATTRIYTEAQMLAAVAEAHRKWDALVASQDAEIERLRDALVELTRLDPPETECANVRVVVYGNDARNFALRALTPNV